MLENGSLLFLLTDHLRSTAITGAGANGGKAAEVGYKAWGTATTAAPRPRATATPGSFGRDAGPVLLPRPLVRPALGRFVQADTVVPKGRYPQALNRYT
jgi:hypothetical protein